MSNSRACPGHSSPAGGIFPWAKGSPSSRNASKLRLGTFLRPSPTAPHDTNFLLWKFNQDGPLKCLISVQQRFEHHGDQERPKRSLGFIQIHQQWKKRLLDEKRKLLRKLQNGLFFLFFLARHRLMLPSFMICSQIYSKTKKEQKKKLGPLIKTKKSIICRNAAAPAVPEKHLCNTLQRLSAVHSKTQNLPSGAFLLIMKIS